MFLIKILKKKKKAKELTQKKKKKKKFKKLCILENKSIRLFQVNLPPKLAEYYYLYLYL